MRLDYVGVVVRGGDGDPGADLLRRPWWGVPPEGVDQGWRNLIDPVDAAALRAFVIAHGIACEREDWSSIVPDYDGVIGVVVPRSKVSIVFDWRPRENNLCTVRAGRPAEGSLLT